MDDLDRYAWIDDADVFDAGCVGVAIGASEAEVVRAFQVDTAQPTIATGREAFALQRPGSEVVVQVARMAHTVVVFEPNGYEGTNHALAAALSVGGCYASYYQGAMAQTEFVYAERGALLRSFEPLLYENDGEATRALPVEHGLPFGEFEANGKTAKTGRSCLMLIERITGVAIERAWLLDEPHQTYCRRGEVAWPEDR